MQMQIFNWRIAPIKWLICIANANFYLPNLLKAIMVIFAHGKFLSTPSTGIEYFQ
jgi:hypothetical protein